MNTGTAVGIFTDLAHSRRSEKDKLEAIKTVLDMETTNSITKEQFKEAFKWFFDYVVEEG